MKGEICGLDESFGDKPYPKLMVAEQMVILFTDKSTGTVVADDDDGFKYDVGYWADDWFDEDFEDFTGKVTLSND